ncbi:MAG: HDOD domain-containing protein [Planctomycetota bacterium]|nr:HDOD domain-containing protein [Planctomycetota bacterium]
MPAPMATTPVTLAYLKSRNIQVPVCPEVFGKLQQVLNDSHSNAKDLAGVIALDPALTGEVLKAANSAYYGMSRNVRSVEDAIFRLGYREVALIATALNSKKMFAGKKWSTFNRAMWEHAAFTATIARALGARLNQQMADVFFTAGLLHDLGKMIFQQVDADYAGRTLDGAVHGIELCAQETAAFGVSHSALGAELLASWDVPGPVARLVEHHHMDPFTDPGLLKMRGSFALANELAHDHDWRPDKGLWSLGRTQGADALLICLGLDGRECLQLREKAVEQARSLMG